MSERTGIPVSTLSKVEHDRLTLTYDKLQQLSQRLNLRMSELFAEPEEAEAAVTARRSIGRIDDAIRVQTPNYDYYYLCPELRRKRMIPVLTRVRAKSLAEFGELVHHSGEEFIHVLEAGESVYIDSNMGHAYTAAKGCDEVLLLGVCSSADEQLMESLLNLHGKEPRTLSPKSSRAKAPKQAADRTPARKPAVRSIKTSK
jgi:transcriptional regulator with XRE-family HTH domain